MAYQDDRLHFGNKRACGVGKVKHEKQQYCIVRTHVPGLLGGFVDVVCSHSLVCTSTVTVQLQTSVGWNTAGTNCTYSTVLRKPVSYKSWLSLSSVHFLCYSTIYSTVTTIYSTVLYCIYCTSFRIKETATVQ